MKYITSFCLLFTLFTCDLYKNYRVVTIYGISKGKIVVSSVSSYKEMTINGLEKFICMDFNINKGEVYYFTFYKDFYDDYSRFPSGCVSSFESETYVLNNSIGILTMSCNSLNFNNVEPLESKVNNLTSKLNESDDPWRYDVFDIKKYLMDHISLGSLSLKKSYQIKNLEFLNSWESENPFFYTWYESIQVFYDKKFNKLFKVEVYANGSYCYF